MAKKAVATLRQSKDQGYASNQNATFGKDRGLRF